MSRIYDNWERLVAATLKREQLWQLCHTHSREPSSISSKSSDFSWPSPLPILPFDSWYDSNSVHDLPINAFESQFFVNGASLSQEELNILLSCPHPPKKLKPGYYWYDKCSGFWGKQGQRPSQIISPDLNVGGYVQSDASNGNTRVLINGREITKLELRVLQVAGVKCRPDTHIWLDKYGGYTYEGMSSILGYIRDKVGVKLVCSVLSVPFPPVSSIHEQSGPQCIEQNDIQKLLLVGCNGSGTGAFFKQAAEILQPDCKPSNVDVGHVTSSIRLSCLDFSLPDYYDDDDGIMHLHDSPLRFQLIRLMVKDIEESSTWLPMFGDVQIVIFCISLCDYDEFSIDDDGSIVNKMLLSRRLFEEMVTHPAFDQMHFLLVLNKFDLFEEKMKQIPLSQCDWFDDFRPVAQSLPALGQMGFHYIASKFKRLYSTLTSSKLYVSLVSSIEPNSVDAALKYAREILKWDSGSCNCSLCGYCTDSSSFSD